MSLNDPLGDLLSRIRNAQMRNKSKVTSPNSRLRESVLDVLKNEGYIRGYAVVERDGRSEIEIELKYFDGEPVIREIERVSKPGRRVYTSVKSMPRINNGLGVTIVSTPKGVMADHDARWKAFVADADWKIISKKPEYSDALLISKITRTYLTPAPFSQV